MGGEPKIPEVYTKELLPLTADYFKHNEETLRLLKEKKFFDYKKAERKIEKFKFEIDLKVQEIEKLEFPTRLIWWNNPKYSNIQKIIEDLEREIDHIRRQKLSTEAADQLFNAILSSATKVVETELQKFKVKR